MEALEIKRTTKIHRELRTSAVNWTQQRRKQTWGGGSVQGKHGSKEGKDKLSQRDGPGRTLLLRETYREWAEAEATLEKTFTENLPK